MRPRKTILTATVARFDPIHSCWCLMTSCDAPRKGWAANSLDFPDLEALVSRYDVVLGAMGTDQHSAYVEVLPAPAGAPTQAEREKLTEQQRQLRVLGDVTRATALSHHLRQAEPSGSVG